MGGHLFLYFFLENRQPDFIKVHAPSKRNGRVPGRACYNVLVNLSFPVGGFG